MKRKTEKELKKHTKRLQYYKLLRRKINKKIRSEFMALERITNGHAKEHLASIGIENTKEQVCSICKPLFDLWDNPEDERWNEI